MKEKMLKKRSMSDKTAKEIMKEQLRFLKSQLYIRYYEILNVNIEGNIETKDQP